MSPLRLMLGSTRSGCAASSVFQNMLLPIASVAPANMPSATGLRRAHASDFSLSMSLIFPAESNAWARPRSSCLFQPKLATKCAVRYFPVTNCSAARFSMDRCRSTPLVALHSSSCPAVDRAKEKCSFPSSAGRSSPQIGWRLRKHRRRSVRPQSPVWSRPPNTDPQTPRT